MALTQMFIRLRGRMLVSHCQDWVSVVAGSKHTQFRSKRWQHTAHQTSCNWQLLDNCFELRYDGRVMHFNYVWLRDHCRSASCYNSKTNQRNLDTATIDLNIRPSNIRVDEENLFLTYPVAAPRTRVPVAVPRASADPVDVPRASADPVDVPRASADPVDMRLPEAISLPETLPEAVSLPEALPEAVSLPEALISVPCLFATFPPRLRPERKPPDRTVGICWAHFLRGPGSVSGPLGGGICNGTPWTWVLCSSWSPGGDPDLDNCSATRFAKPPREKLGCLP